MDPAHLVKLCRGFSDPSRSVAHVRGKFENFGDNLVADAIEALFPGLRLIDCGLSRRVRWLDSLVGIGRFYRYSCLGGGTLINNSVLLPTLQFVCSRTIPLFTMGSGVIDPEFVRGLYGPGSIADTCIEGWIECLEKFRFVSVRGVESQRTLADYGFRRATVTGDPALYFARDVIVPKRAAKHIGVNVSNYSHFWGHRQEETVRILSDLIARLTREDWTVTLFPSMPEDHALSLGIRAALNLERIKIFGNYSDRMGLLDQLAAQDLFVGVKLHTVIAACCVSTPAIMIGYQPKCLDFMRTMDLEEFHIRTDQLELDNLIDRIRMMFNGLESIQYKQFESSQSLRGRLLDFRDKVLGSVEIVPTTEVMPLRDRAPKPRGSHPMVGGLKETVRTMLAGARTSLRTYRGGSDHKRWEDARSLSPDWDSRTEQIARLIPPAATVLEFGAGRMALRNYLPEGCKYTPSDLVDRGAGTIICDLNSRELLAFPPHEVAVFSGVLEYVNDVSFLIKKLSDSFKVVIASYCVRERIPGRVVRRSHGWVNDYTSEEFEEIFARAGFRRDRLEDWRNQRIYRFVRDQAGAGSSARSAGSPSVRGEADEETVRRRRGDETERATMKLAFVVKDLYYGGGAYYDILSRRLAKQGNRVWLISAVPKDADDYRKDGVQFVHVPIWRSAVPFTSLLRWDWRVSRVLRAIEAEHGLDVVEFPSFYPESLVYAFSRRRAAVCIRVHEGRRPVGLGWLWRDPRDALREALCWLQMARADVILPNSALVRDTCVRFPGSARQARKIFTIHPGIDLDLYAPTPLPPAPYRALDGRRIILFVGRITEAKGTYSLIEAFKNQIAPRFADTTLVLVGVPEEPDRLRRALEGFDGNAIHLDDVQTRDLPSYYSHAYVFVGPSRAEPFGAVFVEALACGLPVISVARGGPLEIVEPERTGLLCPDNSAGAIAQALERILSDRDLHDRMVQAARASVVDRFGIDGVVSQLMEKYRAIAGCRNGS
jgi:glycosyltransferase involved in cell wall biosynthesis